MSANELNYLDTKCVIPMLKLTGVFSRNFERWLLIGIFPA